MSVMTFGFNRYELFTRKLAFQMATGERLFVVSDRFEKEALPSGSLVIVNADEPFVTVGSAVLSCVEAGNTVLLYGERVQNELLYRCFKDNERVSIAVCMEEGEYNQCCSALRSNKRYVSVAAAKKLKRQPLPHEKNIEELSEMQLRVLFSFLSGSTASEIAQKEGTTIDSIRHIKSNLHKTLDYCFGERLPVEAASWLFS